MLFYLSEWTLQRNVKQALCEVFGNEKDLRPAAYAWLYTISQMLERGLASNKTKLNNPTLL